jgi:hypothetical protein
VGGIRWNDEHAHLPENVADENLFSADALGICLWAITWDQGYDIIDVDPATIADDFDHCYGDWDLEQQYSHGNCTWHGTNGTVLPAGTQLQIGEYFYTTDTSGTVGTPTSGHVTVAVTSSDKGLATNADAAEVATIVTSITGITSAGVVAAGGIVVPTNAQAREDLP